MSERLPPGFVLDPVKPPVRGLKGMEKVEPKTPSNLVKKTALRGVAEPALPEAVTPAPEGMLARAGWADRQGLQGMLGGLREVKNCTVFAHVFVEMVRGRHAGELQIGLLRGGV